MIHTLRRTPRSAVLLLLLLLLSSGSAGVGEASGQDIDFAFATSDDETTQAFARRGLAIDIMTRELPHLWLEETDRSVETFREFAPAVLVRTYDSLQPGTILRTQIDALLEISGDSLESISFVMIDDIGGLRPEDVDGFTTREEGGKHFAWPATNVFGTLDEVVTSYQSDEPEDETLTITTLDDLDPDKRADEMLEEAEFLDETADVLESLHSDAAKQLAGLKQSIASTANTRADKEGILTSLNAQLEVLTVTHHIVAGMREANMETNRTLQTAREVASAGRIPLFVPDLPEYEEEIIQQIDDLTRLIRETEEAEADLEPIRTRLRSLQVRRAQVINEMERWKLEAEESRKRAEILRRRANGLRSGELNMADYRTGTETRSVKEGWTYQADVVFGATMAQRLVDSLGGWSAWEGILLHRTLNSQLLSAELILGRHQPQGVGDELLFKAGWSEIAFLGGKFGEADLSTLPHEAVETGIGIFLTARHSPPYRAKITSFFDKTGPKYVFPKNRSLSSGLPEEFAGRYQGGFSDFGSLEGPTNKMPYAEGTIEVGKLSWEHVSPDYLLRSSSTVTAFLLMVDAGWSGSAVMNPIHHFCLEHWDDIVGRDLPALVRHVAIALQESGSDWAGGNKSLQAAAGILPLAYLDILTNFGLSRSDVYPASEKELDRLMMAEEYWGLIRPGLRVGLDREGMFLTATNLDTITKAADEYLVCAVKFVGDQGSDTPEGLVETCWP